MLCRHHRSFRLNSHEPLHHWVQVQPESFYVHLLRSSALGYLLVSRRPYPEAKSSSQRTTHGILQVEPNQPARSLRSGDIHNAAPCVSDLNASASVDKRRRGVPRAHFKSAFAAADNGPKGMDLVSSSFHRHRGRCLS